ncbi:MAG: RidA family protein [Gammaproteobacteria bacterium]|nr:RidA family protein [Gammaproteobacteria bacterium]
MLARTNYAELGLPVGPYTHAVSHSNTLYTSGMTAFATPAEKQDINKQLEEIFRQIAFICEQHQTSLQQLIKVTLFVTSFEEIQQARQTLFNIYGEHIPASSLIRVNSLFSPDLKVEVEAIISLSNKEN